MALFFFYSVYPKKELNMMQEIILKIRKDYILKLRHYQDDKYWYVLYYQGVILRKERTAIPFFTIVDEIKKMIETID